MILMLLSLLTAEAKYYRLVTTLEELLAPGNTFIMVNSGYGEEYPNVASQFNGKSYFDFQTSPNFNMPGVPGSQETGRFTPIEIEFITGADLVDANAKEYYSSSILMRASRTINSNKTSYIIGIASSALYFPKVEAEFYDRSWQYVLHVEKGEDISFRVYTIDASNIKHFIGFGSQYVGSHKEQSSGWQHPAFYRVFEQKPAQQDVILSFGNTNPL